MIPTTTDAAIERLQNFFDSDVPHSAKFLSNFAGDIRLVLAEITRLRAELDVATRWQPAETLPPNGPILVLMKSGDEPTFVEKWDDRECSCVNVIGWMNAPEEPHLFKS